MLKNIIYPIVLLVFMSGQLSAQVTKYDMDIRVGAEFFDDYLPLLKGKGVAFVGNQTSAIGETHVVDTLLSLGVDIKKVFAPEHGFRGNKDAGEHVSDGKDKKTGLPLMSLYGSKNRKPSKEKLEGVDVVIFDIQDVGARFYTYISTMHYVMQSCAENRIKFIVLDRPNPNGHYVDGPVLKMKHKSFIGMHKIPIVHGMTIGEYAQMVNGEGWLGSDLKCDLTVVKCKGYDHNKFYEVPIPPSPNLPNMASIYLYPSLCLFEGTNVSVGRGTPTPFQIFGSPFVEKTEFSFVPKPSYGSKHPKHEGKTCNGYDLQEFGEEHMRGVEGLYIHWLVAMYTDTPNKSEFFRKDGFFELLTGDLEFRKMLEQGKTAEEIKEYWASEVEAFKKVRSNYLLYTDFE